MAEEHRINDRLVLKDERDQVVEDGHDLWTVGNARRRGIPGPFFKRAENNEEVELIGVRPDKAIHEGGHGLPLVPVGSDQAQVGIGVLGNAIGGKLVVHVENVLSV